MNKEIEVKKGEETNKMLLMRDLMRDLDDLFETVEDKDADSFQKFFGSSNKIVSKKNFKIKLSIECDE